MTRTIQDEAFESLYTHLSTLLEANNPVCIKCWSAWRDGTCSCEEPTWWPLSHALHKLEALMSQDQWS